MRSRGPRNRTSALFTQFQSEPSMLLPRKNSEEIRVRPESAIGPGPRTRNLMCSAGEEHNCTQRQLWPSSLKEPMKSVQTPSMLIAMCIKKRLFPF
ncbi:hypothetical protein NDU88_009784 [Pleurodeles waltl]|uniref:Uncharacterized protein n=1 Tax=Pleurodeles waltl TaxID=8319 RepID=A0AAV7QSK7_PLEWA|nr:hypothetical protein NDU88_009784 [Pleurodeles waltl]